MRKLLLIVCSVLMLSTAFAVKKNLVDSKIYFRFGEAEIKAWFRANDVTLAKIDSLFVKLNKDELEQITIIGSACPRGSSAVNGQLSRYRADKLQDYLINKFNMPKTLFKAQYLGSNTTKVDDIRNLRYAQVIAVKKSEPIKEVARVVEEVKMETEKVIVDDAPSFICQNWWWLLLLLLFIVIACIIVFCILRQVNNDERKRTPQKHGHWEENGMFVNLKIKILQERDWIPEDGYIPGNEVDNMNRHTWADLKRLYDFKSISYRKGEPIFDKLAPIIRGKKAIVSIPDFQGERYTRDRKDGGKGNFEQADEAFAKKSGMSAGEVKQWRNEKYYTWHEKSNGTMVLVPKLVHDNLPHEGGIAKWNRKHQNI